MRQTTRASPRMVAGSILTLVVDPGSTSFSSPGPVALMRRNAPAVWLICLSSPFCSMLVRGISGHTGRRSLVKSSPAVKAWLWRVWRCSSRVFSVAILRSHVRWMGQGSKRLRPRCSPRGCNILNKIHWLVLKAARGCWYGSPRHLTIKTSSVWTLDREIC